MNALITGANRGIGLELSRQLVEAGHEVYAACRKTSPELNEITSHVLEGVDVGEEKCISILKGSLTVDSLDLVINCAGVLEGMGWNDYNENSVLKQFQVNTLGPLRIVKAIEDKMGEGGKIIMITSRMGSIKDNTSGGSYGYRMSKAALNMASVSLAQDLSDKNVAVGIVHPGYVQTAMTGFGGHIDAAESATGILKRAEELNMKNTGTFWHQNGEILPW